MSSSNVQALEMQRKEKAIREIIELNPLDAAPSELAHEVWRTWVCFQYLMPSPLPLAGLIRCWVDGYGLKIEDARWALRAMTSPFEVGKFKFVSDFTSALADKVVSRMKQREQQAETARIRREQEALDAEAATPEMLKALKDTIAGIGKASEPGHKPARDNQAFLEAAREFE